jgi:cytochrome P450
MSFSLQSKILTLLAPDVFYVDWWPFGPQWVFIADPDLASKYITTGQSLRKSTLTSNYVNKLLGKDNMVSIDGPKWKMLRSIFNPGFSASHLMSLVPYMLDSTLIFVNACREKAKTNELFQLDRLATRYAIDIIGKVSMNTDFNSQISPHPIVETFRRQITLLPATSVGPFDDLNPLRPLQLWWNTRKLNSLIGLEVDKGIAARKPHGQSNGQASKKTSTKERSRSILDLALDAYEKENPAGGSDKTSFSLSFRETLVDTLKTFIFAGHDTTSATISYTMYLLHLHPLVHKRVAAELDSVYGTDCSPEQIATGIRSQPHSINKLEYLNAVIKETLRIFPPASTLRVIASDDEVKDFFIPDPKTGKSYPLKGFDAWPIAHMIHRNEDYFPEPVKFIPERFLPSETPFPEAKLFTPAGKDAWRPFEKGPRNCIGQELAMMETKILLSCIVKEVDFTAEFAGKKIDSWTPVETVDEYADGVPGAQRRTIEGHFAYQVLSGAANPCDAMPGRLRLRKQS